MIKAREKAVPRVAVTAMLPPILLDAQIKITSSTSYRWTFSSQYRLLQHERTYQRYGKAGSLACSVHSSVTSLVSSSADSTSGYSAEDSFIAKRAPQHSLLSVVFCICLQRDSLRSTLLLPKVNAAPFTEMKRSDSDSVPV